MIEHQGFKQTYIVSGCIRIPKKPWPERLKHIFEGLSQVIVEYMPTTVAIENIFVHKNVSSALKLGQARGAAMVAVAKHGLDISEYTPRQIKKAVVGFGGADKIQVQHMMQKLLGLNGLPQKDAADALAVAFCHGENVRGQILGLLNAKSERAK